MLGSLRIPQLRNRLSNGIGLRPSVGFTDLPQPQGSSARLSSTAPSPPSFHGVNKFLTLRDFSPEQILHLVQKALTIKNQVKSGLPPPSQPFAGRTLGMVFSKRSTRTRVSCESGWAWYGGHPMFLGANDIQVGGGEPWKDTSIIVGSMVDCVLARLGEHEEVETLAQYSAAPVINGLTAKFHPLQILADIMTIYESYAPTSSTSNGPLVPLNNLKVAWVGDGNNILNDLMVSLPRIGISLAAATPKGYESPEDVVEFARQHSKGGSRGNGQMGTLTLTHDPLEAIHDADVLVTDTWISMGQETEKAKRLKDFAGYQITEAMARQGGAKADWKFMHCLPRKSEEVDEEVFYGPRSIVWQEGENRKYTVMAVYEMIMIDVSSSFKSIRQVRF
ncbi:ornithine carbamoyltransferase [Gonapodya prolifera JEL478]|uniref:ornithine carbamoyltransferase n=1 Tax=Gonapodya prolifera (strain JEL478) TaxID=1344416 RepID=A0A139ATB4_GONPJ|nr:ornithine carbamoyltransferase [Gonapodya prolifera JEL478]|eukprot:KXS19959.1 ornithine carbamoyltransferase [Gonapodya prolifera JEL478]